MNTHDTITTFVDFFRERGHRIVPGSSLLPPDGDPVLYTTSGMHPLTPYLEGRPHPVGRRLVNVQRCMRTTDLEEVGDVSHLTVFEMLGSWSFGDYDERRSQRWGYELLVDRLGIDPRRLHVTVFGGDDQLGRDEESVEVWNGLGVPVEPTRDGENWWSNGPTGPCGPDSEVFYWVEEGTPQGTPTTDDRWVELWNHVSMRFRRLDDGSLVPLEQRNVDTGMGLERLLMVLQDKPSIFECDLFEPWWQTLPTLWPGEVRRLRVLCDHLRSSVVVVGDGVRPSNTGRGYVLRRLLRRVLTQLWRDDPQHSLSDLPSEPLQHTLEHFEQSLGVEQVRGVLLDEENRFRRLVERGQRLVSRELRLGPLDEGRLRYLHETHGLPPDLVDELLVR